MARYRLRFLLQEFDLPRGTTLLGRGYDCHVTIEDPLVSRQHARIEVEGDRVTVFDLGSRNGVKVNGAPLHTSQELRHGDRLRIGTQELVLSRVEARALETSRTTGFLQHCSACRMPYPRESGACPNCGANMPVEETQVETKSQAAWTFELQVQVLERALNMSRLDDAARILGRATAQLDECLQRREPIDSEQLSMLVVGALRTSFLSKDPVWAFWSVEVYLRVPFLPSKEVLGWFQQLVPRFPELAELITALVAYHRIRASALSEDEVSILSRLHTLVAPLEEGPYTATPLPVSREKG